MDGWMASGDEMVFLQITSVISSVAFFYYLLTHKQGG
jgi:hypothetical protein